MKLFHLLSLPLALKCDQKIFQNEMQSCMKSNWFLLFVIYQRIFVLSIRGQQSYCFYFKKRKEKGKKHLALLLKRKNYTVCSVFEIPWTVDKLGFSCKERHAKVWFSHLSLSPSPAPLVQSNVYEVPRYLRNAPLHPGSNKMLLEWNISRTPFVYLFPSMFFYCWQWLQFRKKVTCFQTEMRKG